MSIIEIKDKIMTLLSSNYNYPLIMDIIIKEDDKFNGECGTVYDIVLKINDKFEFVFDNGYISNEVSFSGIIDNIDDIEYYMKDIINRFSNSLYKVRLKDEYLYREVRDMSKDEFGQNYEELSNMFFSKTMTSLTKQEDSIVFGYCHLCRYKNPREIVDDYHTFYELNGRFPQKHERLYKSYMSAKEKGFIDIDNIEEIVLLENKLLKELQNNYNYPMIDKIMICIDDRYKPTEEYKCVYKIVLKLKSNFEFRFNNGYISNESSCCGFLASIEDIKYYFNKIVTDFSNNLYKAELKDLYSYREKRKMSQDEVDKQFEYWAKELFDKNYSELSKQESSIVFGYFHLTTKYTSSSQIVDDFIEFINDNGRYPYPKERLYKVLEYMMSIDFITEEDFMKIKKYSSVYCFEKLCKFIEDNKRFPYITDKEYLRALKEVIYNTRMNLYSEEQIQRLNTLY